MAAFSEIHFQDKMSSRAASLLSSVVFHPFTPVFLLVRSKWMNRGQCTEEYAPGSWMFWNEVLVPVDPIQVQFHYCFVGTLG